MTNSLTMDLSEVTERKWKSLMKKNSNNIYFDSNKIEYYIKKYVDSNDAEEKNDIYRDYIKNSLTKLVEGMLKRYTFSYIDESWKELKNECLSFLILNFENFNPEKGKAFSYFSVILKNYLVSRNDNCYKLKKSNYYISHASNDADGDGDSIRIFDIRDTSNESNELTEDLKNIIVKTTKYIEKNKKNLFKENEYPIVDSLLRIMETYDSFQEMTKKNVFFLVREQNANAKVNINIVVKKFGNIYKKISNEYWETYEI